MVWEAILLFDTKHVSTYEPTVTYISIRISALGNTPALIHFLLNLVWHINQPKPIKHPVDVCHAPNITQRFRTVNYCSDLFYIAQRQQHRAPRQTFAVLSPVNPELFCVYPQGKLSYSSPSHFLFSFNFSPLCCSSLHDNKPVYRLQQQSICRLAFVPPYSVFCSISFRCGGLSATRSH